MRSSDAHRIRRAAHRPAPGVSATDPSLAGLCGAAIRLLFLALATPENPVAQATGRITAIRPDGLELGLDTRLPRLEPHVRFGVEVYGPAGLVQFSVRAAAGTPSPAALSPSQNRKKQPWCSQSSACRSRALPTAASYSFRAPRW